MRDEMAVIDRLRQDLRDVRWPEPAELRARAARRRRRSALAAATSVLVVVAASAVVVANLAAPPPQSTPLAEPSATAFAEIPLAALVQPGDLPVKTDPPLGESGLGEPVRVDRSLMLVACHEAQGLTARWETSRYSRSQTMLRSRPDDAEPRPADVVLSQDVYRLAPQVATGLFARIDALLAPCATWRSTGEVRWGDRIAQAEASHRWEVADRDFAGDEAVLIRHSVTGVRNLDTGETRRSGQPATTAVVRVGDLVTVLGTGRDGTESELRRVAVVAAGRLCVAANPPC